MLIDTHCHLDLPPLADNLPLIMQRASATGVTDFICPAVAPSGWQQIATLAEGNRSIYPAFGIHPMNVDPDSWDHLDSLAKYLVNAVAVGETGLDYSSRTTDRLLQQELFRKQLHLAREYSLPVIIHCRKAFADTLRIFKEESSGELKGVMHAFSGSPETALEAVQLGLLIGVAGSVTWEGATRPRQVLQRVPLDKLLLETDAPDLPPQKHRGEINEPAFIMEIAREVAGIKGVTVEEVATVTLLNAKRLFNV